jgi:RNA polymerase sigma-70 factor (ECF subfamily)
MLGEPFEKVLGRAREGDAGAFAELWRDANPMLLRYLRVTAGVLAEDIASYTWIRVIEKLATFTGDEAGFRRWLVTIARNHHLDQVRRSARRPERLTGDTSTVIDLTGRSEPDAAALAEERMSTDAAIRLIATLPPAQAEMVILRVVVGLDVADVARVVGRSPGAVRVAVHRGLRKLEDTLASRAVPVTQSTGAAFRDRDA